METIALPTKECRGVDMPDAMGNPTGQVIRARKSKPGYIEMEDGPRAKAMRRVLGSHASLTIGMPESPETNRCKCDSVKFVWQNICGQCYDKVRA